VLTLGLLAANVLLVLILASELYSTNGDPVQGGAGIHVPQGEVSTMAPINLPSPALENYAETVAQPLFNQGRKPSRGAEDNSVNNDNPLVLVGIVITPEMREALFLSKQDNEVIHALIGEWVEGWKVDSIEPDRVTVRRGGRTAEIELERGSPSTTAGKSRVRPAPKKK
jgi:hypothetical protein